LVEGAYNITFSLIDKGLLEVVGPTGLGKATLQVGRAATKVQTGRVYDYAAFMLAGLYFALVFTSLLPPLVAVVFAWPDYCLLPVSSP
jgi:hypothetical protein